MPRLTQQRYEANYRTVQKLYRSRDRALLALSATDQLTLLTYYSPAETPASSRRLHDHRKWYNHRNPFIAQTAGKVFRAILNDNDRTHHSYLLIKQIS